MEAIGSTPPCSCCKAKGGFSCNCLFILQCDDCRKCLEHCYCFNRREILMRIRNARDLCLKLLNQAQDLAAKLGPDELEPGWSIDQLGELEKKLRLQLLVVRRLQRRFHSWENISFTLKALGDSK